MKSIIELVGFPAGVQLFDNPNGIASSSPGLDATAAYPGCAHANNHNPERVAEPANKSGYNPVGVANIIITTSRIASPALRDQQPWADGFESRRDSTTETAALLFP